MPATKTRWEIISKTYSVLWIPSDSQNYSLATVSEKVNSVVKRIMNGRIVSLIERDPYGNDKVYQCGGLPFREKTIFYTPVPTTTLSSDVGLADVEISFNTSNFASSGAIYISWDIITYTGKTSTKVSGVSWLLSTHNSGDTVYQLFSLPSDITKAFTLKRTDSMSNMKEIDYQDNRYQQSHFEYYSIVTSNSGVNYLLVRTWAETLSSKLMLTYYSTSDDMNVDADVCIIPDEYVDLVASLAAWELNWDMSESWDAQLQLKKAYAWINEMFWFFNSKIKKTHQVIKTKPVSFRSVTGNGSTNNRY